MKTVIRRSLLLVLAFATAASAHDRSDSGSVAPAVRYRLQVAIDVAGAGRVGSFMDVTFRVRARVASPAVQVRLRLDSLEVVSGQTEWSGALRPGQELALRTVLRANRRGSYFVSVFAEDTSQSDTTGLAPSSVATGYIVAGTSGGFWSQTVDRRFEPPARRGLSRTITRVLGLRSVPDTAHTPSSFPIGRSQLLLKRFYRELHAIDTMGVDALFEDSASQTARVSQALAADIRAGQLQVRPMRAVTPGEGDNGGCGPYMWRQTGRLTYRSAFDTTVLVGLPNVLVEARDGHPLSGGSLVNEFRTNEDGYYDACWPYFGWYDELGNPHAWTWISVYQDIAWAWRLRPAATVSSRLDRRTLSEHAPRQARRKCTRDARNS